MKALSQAGAAWALTTPTAFGEVYAAFMPRARIRMEP